MVDVKMFHQFFFDRLMILKNIAGKSRSISGNEEEEEKVLLTFVTQERTEAKT